MTEFDDLFAFVSQFIEARRRAVDIENADIACRAVQQGRQLLSEEAQAIDPVPACTNLLVEIAIIGSGMFSARMIAVCSLPAPAIAPSGALSFRDR